ncbi:MAG: hypothetical protein HQK92_03355 [Nitrospirae bacterium]|nr:hypothetical protein [Nitrospirota bacterium]
METIKDNDDILAIIYREDDWVEGLNFITPNDLFIQAGSWHYNKGKKLDSHIHRKHSRTADLTHECVYVKQGALKVILFNKDKQFKGEFILHTGDLAIMVNGGHGYEILEDNTQVVETKNGPFIDVDTDKEKF